MRLWVSDRNVRNWVVSGWSALGKRCTRHGGHELGGKPTWATVRFRGIGFSMKKFSKEDQVTLALWSIRCAERVLPFFESIAPEDDRPRSALEAGREWARTLQFRMAVIRAASLNAHSAAKDVQFDQPASFAAHACGQAVATAHVPQHAYGGAYYALKALVSSTSQDQKSLAEEELAWQSSELPGHLRAEIMSRLIVEERPKGLFVTIRKGPDF